MIEEYSGRVLEYSLLTLGNMEVSMNTITPVCFLLERLGYSFDFHYSMTTTGLKSNQVNSVVNEMESKCLIEVNGQIRNTPLGDDTLYDLILDESDFKRVNTFLNGFSELSTELQYIVPIVQFVIHSHIKYNGEDTLVSEKGNIVKSINNILGYDIEESGDLDKAMEFLRKILKWRR